MTESHLIYYPTSLRASVPASTGDNAPYTIRLEPQIKRLAYVRGVIYTASITTGIGLRIKSKETLLYPAMGGSNESPFGIFASSAFDLEIPFMRDLQGSPFELVFEFTNSGGAPVDVGLLVATCAPRVVFPVDTLSMTHQQKEPEQKSKS